MDFRKSGIEAFAKARAAEEQLLFLHRNATDRHIGFGFKKLLPDEPQPSPWERNNPTHSCDN